MAEQQKSRQEPAEHAVSYGVEDRVAMVSRRADGTPDQTPGFRFVGDKDDAIEGARHQFASLGAEDAEAKVKAEAEVDGKHEG